MIEARGLSIGYGSRHPVATDIALDVAAGSITCLLGPNGCGKTTLLKTLIGAIPILCGSVRVEGMPIDTMTPAERARRLASVPQQHAPPFPFTVSDVVMLGRQARLGLFEAPGSEDRKRVQAVLAHLGCSHLADRDYSRISGGQRQMVLIARALVQDTHALVLDEPTASLDYGNQIVVLNEIAKLARDGYTVLFSTHDPNHALAVADRAVLMGNGRILANGPAGGTLTGERLSEVYGVRIEVTRLADLTTICVPRLGYGLNRLRE
ncbi:ABC transporter ATP-binding protein [Pararhizobium haloflavum]|uniref:ABC transporter ATP-binding protein n=1 Tax=Pararhizobium haloflavum TaxID=2037914 RepID=UPI0018E4CE6F|nr:ABC transporter ATP-binding protein [Pararhizobium haloflavum]